MEKVKSKIANVIKKHLDNIMKKYAYVAFILTFISLISLSNAYVLTYYGKDDGGTTIKADLPSVYTNNTCSSNITLRITAGKSGSGSYSVNSLYLSPQEIIVASAPQNYNTNVTCKNIGTVNGGGKNLYFYETSTNSTFSGTSANSYIQTVYNCGTDANEKFIYNYTWLNDSYSRHPYGYGAKFDTCSVQSPSQCNNTLTSDLNDVIDYITSGYYSTCGNEMRVDAQGESNTRTGCGGVNTDVQMNYWNMIPFNSMATGRVNLSYFGRASLKEPAAAPAVTANNQYYLWDTVTNTTTDLGTTYPFSGELNLQPYREYWLLIGTRLLIDNYNCGAAKMGVYYLNSRISIEIWGYEPAWSCGEFTECDASGTKTRTCVDANNRVPDYIESVTCALNVLENATLGFEKTVSTYSTICKPDWNLGTYIFGLFTGYDCIYTPNNLTIERPLNWTVSGDSLYFQRYFMDFTNEWATEGSRSLKMWTIPPKTNEVDWSGTGVVCANNVTTSNFPIIDQNFTNATMRAYFNVTFPAENMRIRFDAKRCEQQKEQHGDLKTFNTSISATVCPKKCYSADCDTQPSGNFYFDLWDFETDSSKLSSPQYVEIKNTDNRTRHIEYDLSGMGLQAGKTYGLSFAVYEKDPFDTSGNCVMLDNVRYDVLADSFLSIIGGVCESACVGDDFYRATQLTNGVCLVSKEPYACISSSITDALQNKKDICRDSTYLLKYVESINDHQEIYCSNGCRNGNCITDDELAGEISEIAQDDYSALIAVLFHIDVLASIAIFVLSIYLTLQMSNQRNHVEIIPIFGVAQLVFVLSVNGIIPIYFLVGEIFLGAAVIASFISNRGGG